MKKTHTLIDVIEAGEEMGEAVNVLRHLLNSSSHICFLVKDKIHKVSDFKYIKDANTVAITLEEE